MTLALLGVRLLLALVFGAAAVTKLRDQRGFAQSLAGVRVPRTLVPLVKVLVPVLELLTAVMLVPAAWAWWGVGAALLLLGVFTAVAAVSLAQGRTPDCACFGAAAAEPIGVPTLVRNGVLIALALLVLFAGPGGDLWSVVSEWRGMADGERTLSTALLVLLVILSALSLHASRVRAANARLAARVAALEKQAAHVPSTAQDLGAGGLEVGAPAPSFDIPRLEGDRASLASLSSSGRPVALLFLSAHCPACHELWADVERWQTRSADQVTVAAVCSGSPQTIELKLMGFNVSNVLLEGDAHIAEAYGMSLRPSVVMVGAGGTILSNSVAGVGAIRALVERWLRGDERSS